VRKLLLLAAAGLSALGASAPAGAAIVLVNPSCNLLTGCLFNLTNSEAVSTNPASVAAIEAAYNAQHVEPPLPATIDLTALYQTPGSLNTTSGTFTNPNGLFDFYAVEAGEQFVLYRLASPVSSVNWTTAGMTKPNGQLRAASHIVAYSSIAAVPEPGTWAMMLLGFGAIGASMRRRYRASAISKTA